MADSAAGPAAHSDELLEILRADTAAAPALLIAPLDELARAADEETSRA